MKNSPTRQRAAWTRLVVGSGSVGAGSLATGLTVGHPVVGVVAGVAFGGLPVLVLAVPVVAASVIALRGKYSTHDAEARIGALTTLINNLR